MASIHKDPRGKSPYFYCAFTLPNGKRCFKSTKLKDRNAAMDFCLRMEGAARKAAAHNFSEEQARKILNEIRELSGDSAIRFKSLADYSHEWLRSKEVTTSEGTFVRYSGFVKGLRGACRQAARQRERRGCDAAGRQIIPRPPGERR